MSIVSYLPTEGLSYDPSEPRYWEPEALAQEVERAFELCHGCRMCFKYCDSFKQLFAFVDAADGDVRRVTLAQTASVMDACFQCKLCEVECPYTPRNGHEFQLDFPKLVHRWKAQRGDEGKSLGTRVREAALGDPDRAGAAARASFGVANAMNRVGAHRWFLHHALGIHQDKDLPDFAPETFEGRARARGVAFDWRGAEVVLFQTCYVQHNEPEIGDDALAVLSRNGVQATCVRGLQCCGMPAWEHGDLETLRRKARANLDRLMPFVDAGAAVLVINPTCSMMLRQEWPELLDGDDRERARRLSGVVFDVSEYLWRIRNEDRFDATFRSAPRGLAYHAPCHLRAQRVGFKGRDLLKKIPGVRPTSVIECCGHDGTYAMPTEGFEPSQAYGRKAFDGMQEADAEVWVTDCPLAAVQFRQHAGKKPMHPLTVLAQAYEADGFGPGTSIPEPE